MKKLAFVLMAGIAVFSALAYWREGTLIAEAKAAAEAAALVGNRPGGIVINVPNFAAPAAAPAAAAGGAPVVPAPPAASGETCP